MVNLENSQLFLICKLAHLVYMLLSLYKMPYSQHKPLKLCINKMFKAF